METKMISFTKEELEDLRCCVGCYEDSYGDPIYKELYDKLHKMINDFNKHCGHHNRRRISLSNGHEYDICPNCQYVAQIR